MLAVEAFKMPTPLDTSFNHLGQLYPRFRRLSPGKLHNDSSFWLDGLTARGDFGVELPVRDVQYVQSPRCFAVVRGSVSACVRIVRQVWFHTGLGEMTETTLPLTARVACAG